MYNYHSHHLHQARRTVEVGAG